LLSQHLLDKLQASQRSLPGGLDLASESDDQSRDDRLEVDGILPVLLDVSSQESLRVSKSSGLELRGELLRVVERSGPNRGEEDEGVVSEVCEERSKEGSRESGRSEGGVDDSVDEVGEVGNLLGGGRL